jgi:hypothetical protein
VRPPFSSRSPGLSHWPVNPVSRTNRHLGLVRAWSDGVIRPSPEGLDPPVAGSSERVLEDMDLWAPARADHHTGDIESILNCSGASLGAKEGLGKSTDLPLFGPGHRIVGKAAHRQGPRLHLTKGQESSSGNHEVELAQPAPPVPRHEAIPAPAVLPPRGLLALAAQRVSPRHPLRMRRGTDTVSWLRQLRLLGQLDVAGD